MQIKIQSAPFGVPSGLALCFFSWLAFQLDYSILPLSKGGGYRFGGNYNFFASGACLKITQTQQASYVVYPNYNKQGPYLGGM